MFSPEEMSQSKLHLARGKKQKKSFQFPDQFHWDIFRFPFCRWLGVLIFFVINHFSVTAPVAMIENPVNAVAKLEAA